MIEGTFVTDTAQPGRGTTVSVTASPQVGSNIRSSAMTNALAIPQPGPLVGVA